MTRPEPGYEAQARGGLAAYERYLSSMDASMRQKVALTAAHLLCQGRIADMGMGSGTGSHALAALYPSLEVVGVDMNPTMVALAAERYRRRTCVRPRRHRDAGVPRASLDGILDSSVLHHVTSFSGYSARGAGAALSAQVGSSSPAAC